MELKDIRKKSEELSIKADKVGLHKYCLDLRSIAISRTRKEIEFKASEVWSKEYRLLCYWGEPNYQRRVVLKDILDFMRSITPGIGGVVDDQIAK